MKKSKILDVTLRDGSYAVGFQFSCTDQTEIGCLLEESGIEYMEIGHGMGIGANTLSNGLALHTDKEYLAAAHRYLKKIKYGVFCIPGIASLADIDMAIEEGISFIRVGTNVTEIEKSKEYIQYAKKRGLYVMANYMKSYIMSPQEFSEKARLSESYGADCVYVVDSSGSMQPGQVLDYLHAIKSVSDLKVGFHGHDNLGVALWNTITAAQNGFDFVDCSLCGLGRSAGNTALDLFAINAMKMDLIEAIDIKKILMFSEKKIVPLLQNRRTRYIDVVCGINEFHTSYLKYIHQMAGKYNVNPIDLIEAYAKVDKVNMKLEELEEIGSRLGRDETGLTGLEFWNYLGGV